MAEQDAIYKCSVCGNVVSVIEAHEGTLTCCGKEMIKQDLNTIMVNSFGQNGSNSCLIISKYKE